MANYGEVARRAVGLVLWKPDTTPVEAWAAAGAEVFPRSPSSREKSCPRGAFLGLCEEGVIAGVPPGSYTGSVLNKGYALRGLAALRSRPHLATDRGELWSAVTEGEELQPNAQMDVVTALWDAGLVR